MGRRPELKSDELCDANVIVIDMISHLCLKPLNTRAVIGGAALSHLSLFRSLPCSFSSPHRAQALPSLELRALGLGREPERSVQLVAAGSVAPCLKLVSAGAHLFGELLVRGRGAREPLRGPLLLPSVPLVPRGVAVARATAERGARLARLLRELGHDVAHLLERPRSMHGRPKLGVHLQPSVAHREEMLLHRTQICGVRLLHEGERARVGMRSRSHSRQGESAGSSL